MAAATSLIVLATLGATAATTTYAVREQNMASKSAATIQGQQANAQAKQLELQAQAERTQAEVDELERQKTLDRVLAAQNAVFGSSGFTLSSGTFTGIQRSDAAKAAQASRLNQTFTDTRQVGFSNNIRQIRNEAYMTRRAGRIARRTNTLRGFTSVISSGSNAYTSLK